MKRLGLAWMLVVAGLAAFWPAAARADEPLADPAYDAAVRLLRQCVTIRRDGEHNRLLWSLRHLKDPDLRPLYHALAQMDQPALRINGVLGLGEISNPPQIDLKQVAAIDDPRVQVELVSAALDSKLLDEDACRQLLGWEGLDVSVKMVLATHMLKEDAFKQSGVLKEAIDSDNLGRRSMAYMLLLESGDASAIEGLHALSKSTDPDRDAVRARLLEVAMRQGFSSIRPWAYAIATEKDVHPGLGLLAMRAAMRFGERRAVELWREQFQKQTDIAERTRFAIVALQLSPWMDPQVFDTLIGSDDPFIRQTGHTGSAVAGGDANLEEQVIALLQTYHPLAGEWALSYARELAAPEDAHQILLGLILVYEDGPERGRATRLNQAIEATQLLFEKDPEIATSLLRPILANSGSPGTSGAPGVDPQLVQGILLGLVRTNAPDALAVIEGMPSFQNPSTNQLALLLRARAGSPLDDVQRKDLAILVRGGGRLQDSLRIQAAWLYLKHIGRANAAISEALNG